MRVIDIASSQRDQLIDITAEVRRLVAQANITCGICLVFCLHTTAGITINENADPDVQLDMLAGLQDLVPSQKKYRHVEGNSDSHIKASLVGSSASLIVDKGELVLGTWQGIYFCEFDGPRQRKVYLQLISG